MSFHLHNGQFAFHISRAGWGKLLDLGQMYGWRPSGTEPPQWDDPAMQAAYADQSATYTRVGGADASALAHALELALPDIPSRGARPAPAVEPEAVSPLAPSAPIRPQVQWGNRQPKRLAAELPSREFFAGDRKRRLIEFIAFAKHGDFSIHQS